MAQLFLIPIYPQPNPAMPMLTLIHHRAPMLTNSLNPQSNQPQPQTSALRFNKPFGLHSKFKYLTVGFADADP